MVRLYGGIFEGCPTIITGYWQEGSCPRFLSHLKQGWGFSSVLFFLSYRPFLEDLAALEYCCKGR